MVETIAVITAHPDDEVLGCGGVMARLASEGYKIHPVFLADGETSRNKNADISQRNETANKAAKILGAEPPIFLGLPDNQLDSLPLLQVIQKLEPEISHIDPQIIYTHHGGDLNIDHRTTHQAVLTICRPQPHSNVRAIYGFETLSSTEWASPETSSGFRPTKFVNISNQLESKLAALKCYENEMRPFPHARSYETVKHQARLRGASVGLEAAEAFSVIREIVK